MGAEPGALFGRPMVLVPWERGQPGVAARASAIGMAVVTSRGVVSAKHAVRGVERALADEQMKEPCRAHRARLRSSIRPQPAPAFSSSSSNPSGRQED